MATWVCATCGPVPAGEIRHLDHNSPHGHEQHRECGSSAGLDWTKTKEHDMGTERDYLTAIGARIATTRKSAGITQVRLAEAVGLSRASIANIEVGNQDTTLTNMAAIARALGVTCDHLVRDPDDNGVSAWFDLARRVTTDEREAERLADKAWRELDAFEAILQRGIAKGLDRARTHQLAIAAERRGETTEPAQP